ncbi:MAG: ABC transporter substrate-binding protein [Proteobacteria bacterium]|nr:ABC transporter substrate-binding protein [Pseudomonadota bacterium]
MAIKLQETLRGVFYAPFYATMARNAFAEEGVEIEFVSSPRPQEAARRLVDGVVDVCWGGPMRVMETYAQIPGCDIVSFAEVVTRDPFMLIGREPRPGFALADLRDLTLASVSEVPTPWLCLQHDLREAGIDPASLRRIADRTMAENAAALKVGTVDVIQAFEPFPSLLEAEGAGHVWYEAARRGPTSYTSFYTRRDLMTARRDELRAMVRAIAKTQRWIAGVDAATIARTVARYFPDLPETILERAYRRYKAQGIWNTVPVLSRAGYDRLRDSMVSARYVDPGTPFEIAVDNSLAEEIVAEAP